MSSELIHLYSSGLWVELGSPSGLSPSYISGYMVDSLGKLNLLTASCFENTPSGIYPELGLLEVTILGEIYKESYYAKIIRDSLGANGYGEYYNWTMLKEGDTTIQRASPTQIAREYGNQKDKISQNIKELTYLYKYNKALPQSIDFISMYEKYVPEQYYHYPR